MDELARRKLEALASPGVTRGGPFHLGMATNPNAIELEIGQMLLGAMLQRRPETVVELGTGPGYSTSWLLLGLNQNQQGHLWSVDVTAADEPLWIKLGIPADRLTYLSNETSESAATLLPDRIDVLFHDCSHQWQQIEKDLNLFSRRITKNGVIIIHDVNYQREMGDHVAAWFDAQPEEYRYEEMSAGCGVGIATRLRETAVPKKATNKRGKKRAKVLAKSKKGA